MTSLTQLLVDDSPVQQVASRAHARTEDTSTVDRDSVLYVPSAGHVTITAQRHLWDAHEVSAGMLSR
jgi:hypothetical protein